MGLFDGLRRKKPQANIASQEFNEQLASMVNDEYIRRRAERKPYELQWRLNSEFIQGNQYLDINPVSQTIEDIPQFYWHEEKFCFNQMSTIIETRIARLTRQHPIHKVRPASGDDEDISAAKVSTMLLQSSWNDQEMNSTYSTFVAWLEFCGTAFWKPIWSTKKGRILHSGMMPDGGTQPNLQVVKPPSDNPDQNDPISTPEGMGHLFLQDQPVVEIREGDIDTAVVPPHEIFPDSSYRSGIKQCRSMIHARAYHIDEIEEMWGYRAEAENVDVMTLQLAQGSVGSGIGYSGGNYRGSISKVRQHAVVKEYYEYPTTRYPKGRFIVVVNAKTVHAGPMPYMIGQHGEVEMPFIRAVCIDIPGRFWGSTVTERCIPIQRRYNALRNRKGEYLNLVSVGQWYEPDGSIDEDTELNNAPGNRIRYRSINGSKPEPVQFPSLPASFENEEHTLLAEFTAISGVSELSRFSEAPSGVRSGVALGVANEQDSTRLSSTANNIGNSVVLLGKYWLRLYRQFVQEPRILRSVGPNREVEVKEWMTSDLQSDDVILENGTALAETPSQRKQLVFDLLNAGLFIRPELSNMSEEGRRKVFEMLEYGHWETGAEDMYWLQRNRARKESKQMIEGEPVIIRDFDDHAIHIEMHNRQRMQAEYDELLKTPYGPLIEQIMLFHIGEHRQALLQQQLEMMAMQTASAGEANQSPTPSNEPN